MALRLVYRLKSGKRRFLIGLDPITLGSSPECEAHLDHPSVSRRHAVLTLPSEGRVVVEDLGSSNGTFVGGRRISDPTEVSVGTVIAFSNVVSELEEVPDGDARAAFSVGRDQRPTSGIPLASHQPTIASNVIECFVLVALPEILSAIEDGLGARGVAERLGGALWNGFPTEWVEIRPTSPAGAAPWFEAGEAQRATTSEDGTVIERDAFFAVSLTLAPARLASAYAPLAFLSLQLLGIARGRGLPKGRRRGLLSPPPLPDPPTVTPKVREIYERAARIAGSQVSVLIRGESGTGKEVLARYLHRAGYAEGAPFVALNCAALPKDLLEAELFGIEKGVATGVEARAGKFELAHGGTLFLDEVGDMALDTQAKILRALQERTVYRLGGRQGRTIDIQVISATNRDLDAMAQKGTFRDDLFFRLAGWEIQLPSLRRRRADVPNLAAHFLEQEASRLGLSNIGISVSAMAALKAHHWPGNIRELHHEISRGALLLSEGELLETRHLRSVLLEGPSSGGLTLEAALERAERQRIEEAIGESDGTLEDVAHTLGISRSTLYRRMRALGIERAAG